MSAYATINPYEDISPDLIHLTPETRLLMHFNVFELEAEVLFYRDGRKLLRIAGRSINERPMEFDLERQ